MSNDATPRAPATIRPGWKRIVLVCRACEKRSKGPKKIGARDVGRALRRALREARGPRPRIVLTSCLGLCPKKAITVAADSSGGDIAVIAFRRGDDAGAAVATLFPAGAAG